MSSVLLPWKEEPHSPLSEEALWLSEDTLYQTLSPHSDLESHLKFEDELEVPVCSETKAEVASLILEDLENLINLDELIKEEPFFIDEKILPILDDIDHPYKPDTKHPQPITTTQYLLKEFENVYDVVEFAHETLTPPQSPPAPPTLTTLEPLLAHNYTLIGGDYPATPQPDIAHELAVVDELVRTRVEDLQWTSGPPSPNSSSSSNFGDCSSDDPEWSPAPDDPLETPRKRAKPYTRNPDKKSRKKEQNKNAATRYRMKKKAEVEVILGEEKELQMYNDDLEGKIKDMQREIKYLKGLMGDLFRAKGLIN